MRDCPQALNSKRLRKWGQEATMTRMPQGDLIVSGVNGYRDERHRARPTVGELDAGLGARRTSAKTR